MVRSPSEISDTPSLSYIILTLNFESMKIRMTLISSFMVSSDLVTPFIYSFFSELIYILLFGRIRISFPKGTNNEHQDGHHNCITLPNCIKNAAAKSNAKH
uniref:Uncharacterized protein n=1 Tax=Kalanchoe fedtschenkoi TaxID=63787 RepID=A0A7N0USD5_KALFE